MSMRHENHQLDSSMNNGWQAAVVDWDRAEAVYRKRGDITIADAVADRSTTAMKDGELCWIVCVTIEKFILKEKSFKLKKAYVWRHDAQEYNWIILEALHPLVSERDIVDMSMKFHEDYGAKIR